MKSISISEFKTHCLRLLEEAQTSGEPIQVTKRGVPIATVEPHVVRQASYSPGQFAEEVEIVGSLEDLELPWDALT